MTHHEITNKMAAAGAHLRMADTYATNPRVIDEIRAALAIILDVGERSGRKLVKDSDFLDKT
jgi:hypothetical protein